MMGPLLWCAGGFLALFALMLAARVQMEKLRVDLDDLYLALED